MSERTRKLVKTVIYATLAVGVILLCGGYSFAKRQYATVQCAFTEHRMLSYIDITDEEKLPADAIVAVIHEYEASNLSEDTKTEALKKLVAPFLDGKIDTGIDEASAHVKYNVRYSSATSYVEVVVIDEYLIYQAEWSVGYRYYADGEIVKYIRRVNDLVGFLIMYNDLKKLELSSDSVLNNLRREIDVLDYQKYMAARSAGKASNFHLLSIATMKKYLELS
ncbi:MAG TPA: hypothetical protein PKB13_09475 [Clostridia bacterium]|nr:hypothetical protein [Clostridia bacterium]